MKQDKAQIIINETEPNTICCQGNWTVLSLDEMTSRFRALPVAHEGKIIIDGAGITAFDSAGALAVLNGAAELQDENKEIELREFNATHQELLELVRSKEDIIHYKIPAKTKENVFYQIGKEAENKVLQADGILILIGDLSTKIFEAVGNWRRFQLPSIISNINSAGLRALPIVGLLSFLIGVVLAYKWVCNLKPMALIFLLPTCRVWLFFVNLAL